MAGRIPQYFIDDLLARSNIIDIIDEFVPLKKAGKDYQACCPFHNEKTPSFTVSLDKQFYHCFGCGAHGNAISFLMEYEKLEFVEAIEDLAQRYNLEVPRENTQGQSVNAPSVNRAQIQSDHDLMDEVANFFHKQLKTHTNAHQIMEYLTSRGLSKEVINAFNIGYAPPEWDSVLKRYGKTQPARQQLLALKLTVQQDSGRTFDFFRDRIIFPIRNKRGKVIGFGGRVLGDGTPKYLNSPETRIFHKGQELYGFYEARNQKHLPRIVVVEGYMDVVALAQHGISYAVASLGTSTTSEHVQSLLRATKDVICCYDGDRAGRDAAWRTLENALPHLKDGYAIRFVFLPDGEDPDTQVRQEGKEVFETRLDNATELADFFFERLLVDINAATDAGKSQLVAQAKPLIEKVPSDFYRDILLEKLGNLVGKEPTQLSQYFSRPSEQQLARQQRFKITPMRRAIALLLQHPILNQVIPYNAAYTSIDMPGFPLLTEVQALIHEWQQKSPEKTISTARVLEYFRERKEFSILTKLATWEHGVKEDNLETEYATTFHFLENQYLQFRMEKLLLKEKTTALTQNERQEIAALLQALNAEK